MYNILAEQDRRKYFELENYLSPISGYPERNVEWFKQTILPDAIDTFKNKNTLLDVGCAHGYFTALFKDNFKNIIGVDFVENRINFAKSFFKFPNISFYCADITNFNNDVKFDAIFTSMAIQHISKKDKIKAFANLHKIASDDCIFLMYDFDTKKEDVSEDFMGPISKIWIDKNLSDIWTCESCEPFVKEAQCTNCGEQCEIIHKYILRKI